MKKAIKWYVLSNVHIALCATFFLIGGFHLFQVEVDFWLTSFIGLGTWIIYVLHRYIGGKNMDETIGKERFSVTTWPKAIFFPIIIIAAVISTYAGLQLSSQLYIPLGILGAVSAAYIAPLFGKGKRLRDFGNIKIFLIAIVWGGVFILPYWLTQEQVTSWMLSLIWLEKTTFIFALTLPFDIRDRHLDSTSKVSTLASHFNNTTLVRIINILLVVDAILVVWLFLLNVYSLPLLIGLLLLLIILRIMLSSDLGKQHELFFLGILDSFIMIQGAIHWTY